MCIALKLCNDGIRVWSVEIINFAEKRLYSMKQSNIVYNLVINACKAREKM